MSHTEQLTQAGLRTPGEARVVSREAWEAGIAEGVRQGLFGLGSLEDDRPACRYFKEEPFVGLAGGEVIIRAEVYQAQRAMEVAPPLYRPPLEAEKAVQEPGVEGEAPQARKRVPLVWLGFSVPKGKVSNLMDVMNFLQSKFDRLDITLVAEQGEISKQEYEDKVREAFRQMGIEATEEF